MKNNEMPNVHLVADHLENTMKSLSEVLSELDFDEKWSSDTIFTTALDNYVLYCTECYYWYTPSYIHDHPDTGEFICEECLKN